MTVTAFETTLKTWRAILGDDRVWDDPSQWSHLLPNVTAFRARALRAVVSPQTTEAVQAIVSDAHHEAIPLFPMSTGRNWGVGSKLPVLDGAVIVDLSGMNTIRFVDPMGRYAVIEPGVTQGALARYLRDHDIPGQVNVTGSGPETSLLGNALERGVGNQGQRQDEICGLEVVLGTGELITTGLWRLDQDPHARHSFHYSPGLGPDVTGLFAQANLGVVTAAILRLHPQEEVDLAWLWAPEAHVSAVVDILAGLRREGVLGDRIEMDHDLDPRLPDLSRPDGSGWGVWLFLRGTERMRQARRAELEARVGHLTQTLHVIPQHEAIAHGTPALRARAEIAQGVPNAFSMIAMARAHGVAVEGDDVDVDVMPQLPGFVTVLPVVPFEGRAMLAMADLAKRIGDACGVTVYSSFNSIGRDALEGYLRVPFKRSDTDAVRQAHAWKSQLLAAMPGEGFFAMRLDVDALRDGVFPVGGDDPLYRRLKQALDPAGIVAPGRYIQQDDANG